MRIRTKKLVSPFTLALVLLVGLPAGAVGDERPGAVTMEPDDIAQLVQGIEGMRRLPVQGVQMV
jgi:hypothetical protein